MSTQQTLGRGAAPDALPDDGSPVHLRSAPAAAPAAAAGGRR